MKTKLFSILLVCVCAIIAIADVKEPTKEELSEQLLIAMGVSDISNQIVDMIKEMVPAQMKQMGVPDEAFNDDMKAHMDNVMELVAKETGWEALKEDYIKLYSDTFSKDTLEGALAFYESPAGKEFVKQQPVLMKKSLQLSQQRMMEMLPKLQEMNQEMAEKLKQKEPETPKEEN